MRMSLQTRAEKKRTTKGNLFYLLLFLSIGNDIHESHRKKCDLRMCVFLSKERKNVHSLRFCIVSHAPIWSGTLDWGFFYGFPFQSTNAVHQLYGAKWRRKNGTEAQRTATIKSIDRREKITYRSVSFAVYSVSLTSFLLYHFFRSFLISSFIPVHSPLTVSRLYDYH